ncbi:MAG: alanine racemase [Peptococcaceae bacterium BRH_c4b]|nr:MAG: alanine racemase [Peptococcaceae bacterium BRH_c4b]
MLDYPTWAEVDLRSIAHNMREINRVTSPGAVIMAVVKANGYGHGMVEVAETVLANGASRLAVARASEGAALRAAGISVPVLVLGYTPPGLFPVLIENNLAQTVYSLQYAGQLNEACVSKGIIVPVHVKLDSGMGRLGLMCGLKSAVAEVIDIARLPNLYVEGIYTHFAVADSPDSSYTSEQFCRFLETLENLRRGGLAVPFRHCANSAGIIEYPQTHLDMVRPGIILYGLYPSREVSREKINLQPAMSFKTSVAMVKEVPPGCKISYGCTYTTSRHTVVATLPVGYADGYPRLLSSAGEILIRGTRVPVLGRICMDQCMVDVGQVDKVFPGEEAVLFGRQAGNSLPVDEVAEKIGTINYELVCMVSARVPRVYLR